MSKYICLIIVLLTSYLNLMGQNLEVFSGINISNIITNENNSSTEFNNKTGLFFGVSSFYNLNKTYSVEYGVLFITKGYKYETSHPDWIISGKLASTSLDIPLTIILQDSIGNKLYPFLEFGPFLSICINGREKGEHLIENSISTFEEKIKIGKNMPYRRINMGLTGSIGLKIKDVSVSLIYSYELLNFLKDGSRNNFVLGLNLGYKLLR